MSRMQQDSSFLVRFLSDEEKSLGDVVSKAEDNCGTGAGGFQGGNDCAEGHGRPRKGEEKVRSGDITDKERSDFEAWFKSRLKGKDGITPGSAYMSEDDWTDADGNVYLFDGGRADGPDNKERSEEATRFIEDSAILSDELMTGESMDDREFNAQVLREAGLQTNAKEDLSDEDISAIQSYTGSLYNAIGQTSRSGEPRESSGVRNAFEALDNLFWEVKLNEEISLGEARQSEINSLSDEEVLGLIEANPEFFQKIPYAARDLNDAAVRFDEAIIALPENEYGETDIVAGGISSGKASEMEAYADDLPMAPQNADAGKVRRALKNLISLKDEFMETFDEENANLVNGLQDLTRQIDSVADDYLRKDQDQVTVYRGVKIDGVGAKRLFDALNAGHKTWRIEGIASTTTNGAFAMRWADGVPGVLMKIKARKGIYVENVSLNKAEDEVILPSGTELNITRVERRLIDTGGGSGSPMILVEAEVSNDL